MWRRVQYEDRMTAQQCCWGDKVLGSWLGRRKLFTQNSQ
jgi:hypothetical protein